MSKDDIASIYHCWARGDIDDEEARELVGDDLDKFRRLDSNDEVVARTPDPSADDDELFFNND